MVSVTGLFSAGIHVLSPPPLVYLRKPHVVLSSFKRVMLLAGVTCSRIRPSMLMAASACKPFQVFVAGGDALSRRFLAMTFPSLLPPVSEMNGLDGGRWETLRSIWGAARSAAQCPAAHTSRLTTRPATATSSPARVQYLPRPGWSRVWCWCHESGPVCGAGYNGSTVPRTYRMEGRPRFGGMVCALCFRIIVFSPCDVVASMVYEYRCCIAFCPPRQGGCLVPPGNEITSRAPSPRVHVFVCAMHSTAVGAVAIRLMLGL